MFLVVLYFYWLCLSGPIRFTHFTVLRIFLNKCMVAVSVWHSFPANYAETWICPKHVCVFCFPLLVFAVAFTCFLPPLPLFLFFSVWVCVLQILTVNQKRPNTHLIFQTLDVKISLTKRYIISADSHFTQNNLMTIFFSFKFVHIRLLLDGIKIRFRFRSYH